MTLKDPRIKRLITLIEAVLTPPSGKGRIILALTMGALCHLIFAIAVLSTYLVKRSAGFSLP